ncbi:hypothetical protein GCM10009720_21150 [Yaniella flava]|uniref:Uncharacterized protein n=2 Tax=Yaniella flava TaxID=287930 RepID=A0ABN2UQ18_9MICC
MSSAQTAQQRNRTNDGKYTSKSHSEADVNLGKPTPAGTPVEQLYANLRASEIEFIEITSNDDGTYYLSHVTPNTPEDFDAALDHVLESDLSLDDLYAEDGGRVEGQSTVKLNVDEEIDQINREAFRKIANTPTEADIDQGYAAAFQQMRAEHHPAIQSGGQDDRKLRDTVDTRPRYSTIRKKRTSEATRRASYGRAYEQGVPVKPAEDAAFEELWNDESRYGQGRKAPKFGHSKSDIESSLETCRKDCEWIEDGSLSPGELLGQGVSKQQALDTIQQEIDMFERGLATRGRSLEDNVMLMRDATR